ncbi:hypothetical protein BD311DRAFT_665176 [Dichomitus squalens]|uniref:F-box domain-containing protein n=1 Tax=Dichomitus squalens TaxID=114155 RepID=A0A4Q9MKH7_9APHY|nr:hypothetical protein BD311DRAFT_665176 [Dichomitus squalens]
MNQLFGKQTVFRHRYAEDPFLCGVICRSSLQRALQSLPVLNNITIRTWRRVVHGLSWDTVQTISSLLQVREVSIIGLLLCPSKLPNDDYRCDSHSSLTSFHYEVPSNRFTSLGTCQTYPFPSEEEALRLVLGRLHSSLEKLVLSSEPAPMLAMSEWQWPHLRELRLRREWNPNPPVSYLSLLAAMPNLRVLILDLALVTGELDHTHPLWPPGLDMTFPLPYLSRLSVSHPHAKDELYYRLPLSIQELSLCCYPHKSEKAWVDRQPIYAVQEYEYPLLTSTDLRSLLETCCLPRLIRLDIEHQADRLELDLLHSIAVLFLRLSWLQVHRYRLREVSEVSYARLSLDKLLTLTHHRMMMNSVGWCVVPSHIRDA